MRKSIGLLLALALWAGISGPAWAQGDSKFSLAPGAGIALPVGGFGDAYNMGLHVGAGVDVNLAKNFYLFGDLRYLFFSPDIAGWDFPSSAKISGGQSGIFSIFTGGKYLAPMSGKLKIYGLAGLGLCFLSTSDLTADYTIVTPWSTTTVHATFMFDSETAFGLLFGGGLVYELKPSLGLFAEIRFVNIFTESESTQILPLVVGAVIRL
jgi:opacity protein-like surface antigen